MYLTTKSLKTTLNTGEGGRSSNEDNAVMVLLYIPHVMLDKEGEVSPEGVFVAAAFPRGKGRVTHHGNPPISGGRRL